MKDTDYQKIVQFASVGGGFVPANERADELLDSTHKREVLSFLEVTARDLKFHRCYFALLSYIYDYMPPKFRRSVPKNDFHQWLKHLQKHYKVKYVFADGTQLVEYESIAFGSMSQKRFEAYVREQLPWIYENVIHRYFEGDIYDAIIANIEEEFKRFLAKL